ncbi:GON-4-like protein [Mytilus galloprovincialis]|uniref:GON-4-like protein n=1 Tax=Mytilus galloprovincialis TaxID=29158 RepID=UPI003F7BB686
MSSDKSDNIVQEGGEEKIGKKSEMLEENSKADTPLKDVSNSSSPTIGTPPQVSVSLETPPQVTISSATPPQLSTSSETPPQTSKEFLFTPPSQPPPKPSTSSMSSSHNTDEDNLDFIKEQLNFLNNESGELATPIHKSNKQKRQDLARKHYDLAGKRKEFRSPVKQFLKLHNRGIKRSPQKIKPRKPKRVRRSIGFAEKSPDKGHNSSGAEADTSEDDSSDDNWKIIDDSSDNEIDKALEENASRQNLTVVNVKNILHQVITNEDVVAMVKNTLHDMAEEDSESLLVPATYEPKMTRSKFKEVLEKDGTIHHPWPLSPLKKKERPTTSFLDLPFTDDDEDGDDEYNPEKEIEMGSYSDEDSESVASSQVSDLGSPRPSTPATPSSTISRFSDLDKTPSVQGDDELKSPMGPPARLPVSATKSMLGKRYHMAMAESDRKAKQAEEETIALRTRSKLSLHDTSLLELESNFVAPDITWDMYETSCDDKDWMTFLTGLQKIPENEDTNDDENDPEYNYLAEVEEEDVDMEDLRRDRAVQISRKEMNELMDELLEAYQDTDTLEEGEKELLKKRAIETVKISTKKSSKSVCPSIEVGLTESQRIQLEHQMRKHVQLLSQMYVLAAGNIQDYQEVKENSRFLLNELQKFSEVNSTLTSYSAYKACNLEEAVEMVNEDKEFVQIDPKNVIVNNRMRPKKTQLSPAKRSRKANIEKNSKSVSPEKGIENMLCRNYKQLSEKKKDLIYSVLGQGANFNEPSSLLPRSNLPNLTTQQREIFWRSLIFIYSDYLPLGNLLISRDFSKSPRVCFTEAEDNLLALGLEQFRNLPYHRRLIQKFMLPCKTEDQIKIRIKNLTAKNTPDNPVKTFKTTKKIPDFPVFTDPFDVNEIKPVMRQDASCLPVWCKEMKIREIILLHDDDELEGCYSIQRSSSVNIPVVYNKLVTLNPNKSKSAPNTPKMPQETTRPEQPAALKVLQFDDGNLPVTPTSILQVIPTPNTLAAALKVDTLPVTPSSISTSKIIPAALKVLQFDSVTTSNKSNPSSPKVTQLQDIGRKTCTSPGFIKLHENLQQGSPITVSEKDFNTNQGGSTDSYSSQNITESCSTSVSMVTSFGGLISSESSSSVRKSGAVMIMHGQTPVTCAAPTFVLVNKTVGAPIRGRIDSTILSSALPSSICSVIHTDITSTNKVISPTKLIDEISKEVQNEFTPPKKTPTKRAAEIVASYAPYYLSPELIKDTCLSQDTQERTPTKLSPLSTSSSRYRPVAPKPIILSSFTSPVKKVSPFLEKKKFTSPRRKQLQTKAMSIRPKGFIPNKPHISPSKKAAYSIINRALKRPKTLLPKPFGMVTRPLHVHVREVEDEEEDIPSVVTSESEGMDTDYMSGDCIDTMDVDETQLYNSPSVFSNRQKHNSGSNRSVESDDTQSEAEDANLYDSQNEDDVIDDEDHLADLMTASSTICFASQRQSAKDKESRKKGMKKKDTTIAMLAPDLLEVDPHKDDKDTAFAQAYLNRTKEALKEDLDKYEQFLKILNDFGKSEQSPIKLYQELNVLLSDYPDLVSDFAGFLLPEQAVECGCLLASQEFKRAKTFLRKLEVYLARHPSHYQKVMKIFSRWSQSETRNVKELREALEPMLKMQPHLLEELSLFFGDERPPDSYMTDYEEITLDDSDEEADPDGYEVIELPDEQDINGTKLCQCNCHKNTLDQNYLKRNRHCYSCCLKVIDGELYFRVSNKVLKKVNVIYHKPIKARSREVQQSEPTETLPWVDPELAEPTPLPWVDDDPIAEKENVDISLLPKINGSKKKKDRTRFHSGSDSCSQPDPVVYNTCDQSETFVNQIPSTLSAVHGTSTIQNIGEICTSQTINQSCASQTVDQHMPSQKVNEMSNSETIAEPHSGEIDIESNIVRGIEPSEHSQDIEQSENSPGQTVIQRSSFVVLNEEANISPRKCEPNLELTSNSSSTLPYVNGSESTTCPDILAKALKVAMIGQGDVSMDISHDNHSSLAFPGVKIIPSQTSVTNVIAKSFTDVTPMLSSCRAEKHFVKELFASSSDSSDSNTIKPIMTVSDEMSNIGVIKSLDPSENPDNIICTIAREEDSTLSQFGFNKTGFVGISDHVNERLPTVPEEDSTEKMENSPISNITFKTFGKGVKNVNREMSTFTHIETKIVSDKSVTSVKSGNISHPEQDLSRSNSRLSEAKSIDSPKSTISLVHPEIESSVIGFNTDSNGSGSSLHQSTEINRLTPRRASVTKQVSSAKTVEQGDNSSPTAESQSESASELSDSGSNSVDTGSNWNKDADRIILEVVKTNGPGSETFNTISKQLRDKTPQQVSQRFHQLLEILASEETPSEEDS